MQNKRFQRKNVIIYVNDNELYIIDKEMNVCHIEKADKQIIAMKILEKIYGKSN